jgi:hypothetical protein
MAITFQQANAPVYDPFMKQYTSPNIAQSMLIRPGNQAGINVDIPNQFSQFGSNPLSQLAYQGAGIEGLLGQNQGYANTLANAFTGNLDWANKALTAAFDPQQSLFKQRQQDLIDATRAGEAARGIAMSPYGAGVESNAVGRFYNDWQNEQIGRMLQGSQAAVGLQKQYSDSLYQAAQINTDAIKAKLQEFGLKGDMLNNAMNQVLSTLKIQADVATAQFAGQTHVQSAALGRPPGRVTPASDPFAGINFGY